MSAEETLWVEDHRPETLDEIVGHESIVNKMQDWVEDERMPHLLFAGPQGTGKTAMVTAFAREKYGDDAWRNNVMEMNASDERGIDAVRDKIKKFAQRGTVGDAQFKIIFLDEVDQMTSSAQPALRRIMEDYSDKTRFVLSCNYLNKIIEPIQSRCTVFRTGRLSDNQVGTLLERVAEREELSYDDDLLWQIVQDSRGDARAAVNTLQSATTDGELQEEGVEALVSVVNDEKIEAIVEKAIAGNMHEAMRELDTDLIKQGVDAQTLADSFLRVLKQQDDIPADAKAKMIDKLGECEWRVMHGANPNVQFHSLLANINVARHLSLENYPEQDND